MMKKTLTAIFQTLKSEGKPSINGFRVTYIPSLINHKIGITDNGMPMFFIKSSISSSLPNISLDMMSVQFCQLCKLIHDNGESSESTYTVISLKSIAEDLTDYFIEIIYLVLLKIGNTPSQKILIEEIEKVVDLFRQMGQSSTKTVQGLWAELLMISQSKNPGYLINSWHISPTDTFDFNDGRNKIEVKSTSKTKRIHHFSLDQLLPNKESKLLICSVYTIPVGQGVNIFDLVRMIDERLISIEDKLRLNAIVVKTLGDKYTYAGDFYYDYQKAIDSIMFLSYSDIPTINASSIPSQISQVHFYCDLSDLCGLSMDDSFITSNPLFISL